MWIWKAERVLYSTEEIDKVYSQSGDRTGCAVKRTSMQNCIYKNPQNSERWTLILRGSTLLKNLRSSCSRKNLFPGVTVNGELEVKHLTLGFSDSCRQSDHEDPETGAHRDPNMTEPCSEHHCHHGNWSAGCRLASTYWLLYVWHTITSRTAAKPVGKTLPSPFWHDWVYFKEVTMETATSKPKT